MIRPFCVCAPVVVIAIVTTGCRNENSPTTAAPPSVGPAVGAEPDGTAPPREVAESTSPPPAPARAAPSPPIEREPAPRQPAVRNPPIRDRFGEVDAALGELVGGNVAFNTPDRMRFRESRTITLIAAPAMTGESLGQQLRERIGGGDSISVEALQIAPLMEAHLEGAPAFEVMPLTPERQPVGRAAPTEWRWNVRANESGSQTLHLTIDAIVTVDGERFPRSLNVLDRKIDVEITAGQQLAMFVEGNWQWVAGTIVIPLAVWWWTSRRQRRRRR
jgi:hypothetical protein